MVNLLSRFESDTAWFCPWAHLWIHHAKWSDLVREKTRVFLVSPSIALYILVKVKEAKMPKSVSAVTPPHTARFPSSRLQTTLFQFRSGMFVVPRTTDFSVRFLSRRSRQRERFSACCPSVRLYVCLSPKCKKKRFSQKRSNLQPWSLLTTYRKSYKGFSKNPLLNP